MTLGTSAAHGPSLDRALEALAAGHPLVIALDVDGTLAPIAPRPDDAVVPAATRDALARLVALPDVHVALVSGRAAGVAQRLVGVSGVWTIGNHGAESIAPDGTSHVEAAVAASAPALDRAHRALGEALGTISGVIVEHKRWSLTVHHRLASRDDVPRIEAAVRESAEHEGLRVAGGKEIFELRARADIDKGSALLSLLETLGARGAGAAVLYVGDDVTDEDAFRALGASVMNAVTVRVGHPHEKTAAGFVVDDPAAVRELLVRLAALR